MRRACAAPLSLPPSPFTAPAQHDHPRRHPPPHGLQVRPGGRPLAARDPAPAGTALPDADRELQPARRAGEALRQLAAGRVRQLHRALRLPRAGARARHHRRPRRRHDGDQSVRLLRRALGRALSVRLPAAARGRARAVLRAGDARTAAREVAGRIPRPGTEARDQHRRFPGRSQPATRRPREVSGAPGAGHPVAGSDARARLGILPRLGLAARADRPAPRARGPVRLGLPHPARRRREAARRTGRAGYRLHRSPRLGRGLPPGRGLDRSRPHLRDARRRGPHPARRHCVPLQRRAGHRLHRLLQLGARLRDEGDPHPRGPARHQALLGHAVGRHRRPWARRRPRPRRGRRPADPGRRADVRRDRRHGRAGVELHRALGKEVAARGGARLAAARPVRARQPPLLRPGQVVSRRAGAALGAQPALAARRPAALAERRSHCARSRAIDRAARSGAIRRAARSRAIRRGERRSRRRFRPRARARARARRELRDRGVRRPAAAAADRRRPAGERRRGESPAQGLRRPRTTAAQPGARHGLARRLCPAAPRLPARAPPGGWTGDAGHLALRVAKLGLALAARAPLPPPRRFRPVTACRSPPCRSGSPRRSSRSSHAIPSIRRTTSTTPTSAPRRRNTRDRRRRRGRAR